MLTTCGSSRARAISGRIEQNAKRFANDRRTIFVGDMGKPTNLLVRLRLTAMDVNSTQVGCGCRDYDRRQIHKHFKAGPMQALWPVKLGEIERVTINL